VWRCQIAGRHENAARRRKSGENRAGSSPIERSLIVVNVEHGRRTDWIGSQSRGVREIRDHQILRDVVVINSVAGAHNGILKWAPCDANARTKIVQVAIVGAVQAPGTHELELLRGGERTGEIR